MGGGPACDLPVHLPACALQLPLGSSNGQKSNHQLSEQLEGRGGQWALALSQQPLGQPQGGPGQGMGSTGVAQPMPFQQQGGLSLAQSEFQGRQTQGLGASQPFASTQPLHMHLGQGQGQGQGQPLLVQLGQGQNQGQSFTLNNLMQHQLVQGAGGQGFQSFPYTFLSKRLLSVTET